MSQLVSSKALTEGMLSPIGHHLSEQGGAKEAAAAAAEGGEEEEAGSAGAVSGGISRSAAGGGGLTTVLDYLLDMPSTYPRFNPAILRAQPGGDGGKKKKQSLMQWRRRRPPPAGGSGSGSAAAGGSSQSERVGPEWVSLSTQTKGDPAAVSATSPEAFAALPATEQVAHVTASLSGGGDDALAGARYIHCSLSLPPRAVSLLFAYLNSLCHTTLYYSLRYRYIHCKGADDSVKGVTHWLIADLASEEGRRAYAAALKSIPQCTQGRLAVLHNPKTTTTTASKVMAVPAAVRLHIAMSEIGRSTPSVLALLTSMAEGSGDSDAIDALLSSPEMDTALKKTKADKVRAAAAGTAAADVVERQSNTWHNHASFVQRVFGAAPGSTLLVTNGRVMDPTKFIPSGKECYDCPLSLFALN